MSFCTGLSADGMDYLSAWNFTHINNAQMKAKAIDAQQYVHLRAIGRMITKDSIVEEVWQAHKKHAERFNLTCMPFAQT